MDRGLMSKCPKCESTDIRNEQGRLEGATIGASRLFFDVYISVINAVTANSIFERNLIGILDTNLSTQARSLHDELDRLLIKET